MLPILEATSSFTRLVRVTDRIYRFVNNWRRNNGCIRGHLSVNELLHAKRYWITPVQHSAFMDELLCLKKGVQCASKSRLLPLHPVLDKHGRIHVGGRCELSKLLYVSHHPVILPGSHTVTRLINQKEHLRLLHVVLPM